MFKIKNKVKSKANSFEKDLKIPLMFQSYKNWQNYVNYVSHDKCIAHQPHIRSIINDPRLYARSKLEYIASKLNEGWMPNWKELEENKYYLYYNNYCKGWEVARSRGNNIFVVYFESEKLAEKAQRIMGADLDYLRVVK